MGILSGCGSDNENDIKCYGKRRYSVGSFFIREFCREEMTVKGLEDFSPGKRETLQSGSGEETAGVRDQGWF